uniref:Uncharacterized protein n=1 Tax=Anguilla anguilla TaxID=7936 RepID=A0A0E9VGF7_ANGAN
MCQYQSILLRVGFTCLFHITVCACTF